MDHSTYKLQRHTKMFQHQIRHYTWNMHTKILLPKENFISKQNVATSMTTSRSKNCKINATQSGMHTYIYSPFLAINSDKLRKLHTLYDSSLSSPTDTVLPSSRSETFLLWGFSLSEADSPTNFI